MSRVTNGKVAFRRTVQPADYESKSAEVELSFALDDGEILKDVIGEFMEDAKNEVLRTLGLRKDKK